MMDNDRGTGRTTRQMMQAPIGAIYIVPNQSGAAYFMSLARHLRRNDLKIHGAVVLERMKLAGLDSEIVVDHACLLNGYQIEVMLHHLDRVRQRRRGRIAA